MAGPHSRRLLVRSSCIRRQRRRLGGSGLGHRGSIRIPAALNGLVGFKSTARLVPTEGTVPLSPTLDTACAITRSVRDAVLLHEILAERKVTKDERSLSQWRLAVPRPLFFEQIEPAVRSAFERSIAKLQAGGAQIEWIDLPEPGRAWTPSTSSAASRPPKAMPGTGTICRILPRPRSTIPGCARA